MKPGYTVEHVSNNDAIGKRGDDRAVIENYHATNQVSIFYADVHLSELLISDTTVAVLRIKSIKQPKN